MQCIEVKLIDKEIRRITHWNERQEIQDKERYSAFKRKK